LSEIGFTSFLIFTFWEIAIWVCGRWVEGCFLGGKGVFPEFLFAPERAGGSAFEYGSAWGLRSAGVVIVWLFVFICCWSGSGVCFSRRELGFWVEFAVKLLFSAGNSLERV
jgi:hypothetical protein